MAICLADEGKRLSQRATTGACVPMLTELGNL